jgi:membrane-associated phospholipid phosphatase
MIPRPWLTPAVRAYSRLGNYGLGWAAAGAVVGIAKGSPRLGVALPSAVGVAFGANVLVKRVVRRSRPAPAGQLIAAPSSSSFPSSHAATAGAGAIAIGLSAPPLLPALVVAAVAMGATRVYLGVHHVSDVVGGLALGALTGGVCSLAVR